jgi:hypothetical protein
MTTKTMDVGKTLVSSREIEVSVGTECRFAADTRGPDQNLRAREVDA